jgi:hypothetical protein
MTSDANTIAQEKTISRRDNRTTVFGRARRAQHALSVSRSTSINDARTRFIALNEPSRFSPTEAVRNEFMRFRLLRAGK